MSNPAKKPPAKRSVGRPRTRPDGATPLAARFSPAERDRINEAARRSGLSAAQWMRQVVIAASVVGRSG